MRIRQVGFTLIELSIVLVIIGLITGALLAGRELIAQAELQAVVAKVRNYQAAVSTFELEFDASPGDFDDATSYWSGTTNGNGDGEIYQYNTLPHEPTLAWEHLSLSEMIRGNYDYDLCTVNSSGNDSFNASGTYYYMHAFSAVSDCLPAQIDDLLVPAAPMDGGVFALHDSINYLVSPVSLASVEFQAGATRRQITLSKLEWINGTQTRLNSITARESFFSPHEALAIDTKLDDGNPVTGNMLVVPGSSVFCLETSGTDLVLRLSRTEKSCTISFIIE